MAEIEDDFGDFSSAFQNRNTSKNVDTCTQSGVALHQVDQEVDEFIASNLDWGFDCNLSVPLEPITDETVLDIPLLHGNLNFDLSRIDETSIAHTTSKLNEHLHVYTATSPHQAIDAEESQLGDCRNAEIKLSGSEMNVSSTVAHKCSSTDVSLCTYMYI